jgi:predicted nucleic acid-binding protein
MGLRTPDAIQLATALHTRAEYLVTNDQELKAIAGPQVLLLGDFLS